MTKQDYELIAQAINDTRTAIWQLNGQKAKLEADNTLRKFLYTFCIVAKNKNPRFDSFKFRESCGLPI
jgi:hypothetical protein